jgi:nonsense-mediated mRNA decay protein 3
MDKAIRCETVEGGIDLQFKNEQDAGRCLSYIKNHLPVSHKVSSQLISHNERDNSSNVKISHALIIPKICKDDLLLMHPRFCKELGNCSPLLLCLKVTSQLYFLDPTTFRKIVITPTHFFSL